MQNSAKIAPGQNGNTNHSVLKKDTRKQGNEAKHWFLTYFPTYKWNSADTNALLSWCKENCTDAVAGLEITPTTGVQHVHIQLSLKVKKRMTWFKHHFNNIVNCQMTRNGNTAETYSLKDNHILFVYPNDIGQHIHDPLEGEQLYDWELNIIEILKTKPDPRLIYWYWDGQGGTGKSTFCKHLLLNFDNILALEDASKKDILYAVTSNIQTVILDFNKDTEEIPYNAIETLKKGWGFSGKYESKMKMWNTPHIICFANKPPDLDKMMPGRFKVTYIGDPCLLIDADD